MRQLNLFPWTQQCEWPKIAVMLFIKLIHKLNRVTKATGVVESMSIEDAEPNQNCELDPTKKREVINFPFAC